MEESNEFLENESELHEHYSFTVEKGQQLLRIDKYLMNFVENATRNKIQAAAKQGSILVNDSVVKSNYKVKAGDVVTVEYKNPPREHELIPQDIPINIMYEDDGDGDASLFFSVYLFLLYYFYYIKNFNFFRCY